jgi:hypothetical protein
MKISASKVKLMDRRMTGHNIMKYHIDFDRNYKLSHTQRVEEFYKVLRWCESQYGVSRPLPDLEYAIQHGISADDINLRWTWMRDNFRTKIMFADKEQAAHYTLVFGV